jgi:hypothetical protein
VTTRTEEFEELRPLLFAIAYRILGSVSEAEDAVQEVWVRYSTVSTEPTSPRAYLSAVITRISINVLRDVFGFGFAEIASIIERSEQASRQLAVRARRHMEEGRPRFEADRRVREELASAFFQALATGDVDGLLELLAADVTLVSDGGGKAPTLGRSVVGAENVARLLVAVAPQFDQIGLIVEPQEINRQPGAIVRDARGRVLFVLALDILDGEVQTVRSLINPDKLGHLGPVADAWAVDREYRDVKRGRGPS